MSASGDGRYEIQYLNLIKGRPGWWIGHHGIDLRDAEKYATRVNKREGAAARIIDKETGEIFGQPGCSMCGDPHEGVDGSCLL